MIGSRLSRCETVGTGNDGKEKKGIDGAAREEKLLRISLKALTKSGIVKIREFWIIKGLPGEIKFTKSFRENNMTDFLSQTAGKESMITRSPFSESLRFASRISLRLKKKVRIQIFAKLRK